MLQMIITQNYRNSFMEVYKILNTLEDDDFKKIPQDVISVIYQNKNEEYDYYLNDELSLQKQPMMPETKAILFNIYRDYLSSPEQKEKIKKVQKKERWKNEIKKKQEYNVNVFNKNNISKGESQKIKKQESKNPLIEIKKDKWYERIKNFLKKVFRK